MTAFRLPFDLVERVDARQREEPRELQARPILRIGDRRGAQRLGDAGRLSGRGFVSSASLHAFSSEHRRAVPHGSARKCDRRISLGGFPLLRIVALPPATNHPGFEW